MTQLLRSLLRMQIGLLRVCTVATEARGSGEVTGDTIAAKLPARVTTLRVYRKKEVARGLRPVLQRHPTMRRLLSNR